MVGAEREGPGRAEQREKRLRRGSERDPAAQDPRRSLSFAPSLHPSILSLREQNSAREGLDPQERRRSSSSSSSALAFGSGGCSLPPREPRVPPARRASVSACRPGSRRRRRRTNARPKMPNFSGNWKMKSSENFEELLKALGVNVMLRKIAVAAASKPAVEIKQDGESFYIKTSTTVRTTEISFKIGEEFEEQTVDGRPCKSLAKWESNNKMVCEQRLLKGDGPKTGWSREMTNDGELILTMMADDVVCTRIYVRE
ncbi:cellular retinoic acid-binding protein 2 [Podarcis muralis]